MQSTPGYQEDRSVPALLYDDHRHMYRESSTSIQREIEGLYLDLYDNEIVPPRTKATRITDGLCGTGNGNV
jgi:hypothetical protein